MDTAVIEKANQIIKVCNTAYIGVIDEKGFPSVSTVSLIKPMGIFEVYFTTTADSNKAKRLANNNKASLCCRTDEDSNITLVGETEIITDQETKSRCWEDWLIAHYPGGETDPNYIVIKFTTKRVSLLLENGSAECTVNKEV